MKGKESAEGKPIGAGETPCFALGFVVSPAHIGCPFAGEPQSYEGHNAVEIKERGKKCRFSNTHNSNMLLR